MGEGLDQRFNKILSSRAEDEEELGESSDQDSSSDEASASPPNPSTTCHAALASQLPIKRRGLSKFYQGKSESFSSFSDVRCVEDLAKKATPLLKREMKPAGMSYANGLLHIETDNNSSCDQHKVPRVTSCASSFARTGSIRNCKPPPIPTHK